MDEQLSLPLPQAVSLNSASLTTSFGSTSVANPLANSSADVAADSTSPST